MDSTCEWNNRVRIFWKKETWTLVPLALGQCGCPYLGSMDCMSFRKSADRAWWERTVPAWRASLITTCGQTSLDPILTWGFMLAPGIPMAAIWSMLGAPRPPNGVAAIWGDAKTLNNVLQFHGKTVGSKVECVIMWIFKRKLRHEVVTLAIAVSFTLSPSWVRQWTTVTSERKLDTLSTFFLVGSFEDTSCYSGYKMHWIVHLGFLRNKALLWWQRPTYNLYIILYVHESENSMGRKKHKELLSLQYNHACISMVMLHTESWKYFIFSLVVEFLFMRLNYRKTVFNMSAEPQWAETFRH